MIKKKFNVQVLEFFIVVMIALFGLGALSLLFYALKFPFAVDMFLVLIIEMLIIVVITVLGLSYLVVRIWEKHIVPYYDRIGTEKKQYDDEDKKNLQKWKR